MAIAAPTRLVLASGSPRRRDLLDGLGLVFTVRAADLDESPLAGEEPIAYVTRLAQEKAAAVAAPADSPPGVRVAVLAADTTVALGREILAKPVDATDARRMLHALSGAVHQVHTGVALHVCDGAQPVHSEVLVVTTEVEMVRLDDAAIDWYVSTGEPMDKAGAYAIQGRAASFVRAVHGSVTNVVGLPMAETVALLAAAGIPLDALRG